MSNEKISEIAQNHIWAPGLGIDPNSGAENNNSDRGHPEQIEDVVAFGDDTKTVEKLKSAEKLEDILGLVNIIEQKHTEKAKEEIYQYERLLGEQLDENYVMEAARAALIEMITPPKTEIDKPELTIRIFSSLFADKLREKEMNPVNKRDTEGQGVRTSKIE